MKEVYKLIALVAVVHVAAIAGACVWWDPIWLVLSLIAYIAYLWFGHDLYYHRYLSHRAFDMPVAMQRVCAVLGVFCLFGTPIGIAATHVRHHRHADTDKDPHPAHSPWRAWFWVHPSMGERDRATVARLSKDRWLRFLGKHYFRIYLVVVLVAFAVDPRIAIYGFFVPVVYAFFSNGLVNVVCHRVGYRLHNTKDSSRNNLWVNLALLFGGIALHNTHHAEPKSYQLSRAWYEIDLVGVIAHYVHGLSKRSI